MLIISYPNMVLKPSEHKLFGDKMPDSVLGYIWLIFVLTTDNAHS